MTNEQLEAIRKLLLRWQGVGGSMLLSTQGEHVAVSTALLAEVDRLREQLQSTLRHLNARDNVEQQLVADAVLQEREACAAIADRYHYTDTIAAEIRQRGA